MEEEVTKQIIDYLNTDGWNVVCFDFPQSGTGMDLHLNPELRTGKNKGKIVPDIIATKNNVAVLFENKNRFVLADFEKIDTLRKTTGYSNAIGSLLTQHSCAVMYYGIGLPHTPANMARANLNLDKVDFLLSVSGERVNVDYQRIPVF